MAQERAPETILRAVLFCIASFTVSVAAVAFAQPGTAPQTPVFLSPVTYDSGGYESLSVARGDLNGDGAPDLVVANLCTRSGNCRDGTVGVLLGNGDGTFQPAVTYDTGGHYTFWVTVGDLNGDGRLDIVVANECVISSDCANGAAAVLYGQGGGTFGQLTSFRASGWRSDTVAVGDLNGDGNADLLVANLCVSRNHCSNATVDVWLGLGDGYFQERTTYSLGGPWSRAMAVEDLNGDGKIDVVVALEGGITVLLGNGDGTLRSPAAYFSGGSAVRSVTVADTNGDGMADLVAASSCLSNNDCSSGAVGVLLGNGDGSFQPPVTYSSGALYGHAVAVGDVNGDGYPDLVVASQFGPTDETRALAIGVLLGNGDGTFQPAMTFESGGQWPTSLALGDLNGDGKPDVVVANDHGSNGGAVGVLLNDTPFCTTPPVITVSATPRVLWPAKGRMIPVTVFGTITNVGCTVSSATYAVTDEYGTVQPIGPVALNPGGAYSFTALLKAWRRGTDMDGRVYTISISAGNNASMTRSAATTVIVPHDQRQ